VSRMLRFSSEEELNAMLKRQKPRVVQPMPPIQNKFYAKTTEVDGITFDSKKEAKRYQTLDALQSLGKIAKLRHHVRFELKVNDEHLGHYEADFCYIENEKQIIEDTKGMKRGSAYDLFRLKARLMKAIYGVEVREV
jgi:hypothetical protein